MSTGRHSRNLKISWDIRWLSVPARERFDQNSQGPRRKIKCFHSPSNFLQLLSLPRYCQKLTRSIQIQWQSSVATHFPGSSRMHEGKRLPRQHNTREEKGLYFASLGWGGVGWGGFGWDGMRWAGMGWDGSCLWLGWTVLWLGCTLILVCCAVMCRDVVWHDGGV